MMPDTQRYFERIYDHRKAELYADPQPSDFVFVTDGREIGSFKKSFASLLEYASLTYNARGQKDSLRHTYATFRPGPMGKVSVTISRKIWHWSRCCNASTGKRQKTERLLSPEPTASSETNQREAVVSVLPIVISDCSDLQSHQIIMFF